MQFSELDTKMRVYETAQDYFLNGLLYDGNHQDRTRPLGVAQCIYGGAIRRTLLERVAL